MKPKQKSQPKPSPEYVCPLPADPEITYPVIGYFRRDPKLYSLCTSDFKMTTLAKSEDPDEMLHIAAFHQGLHHLL